MAMYRELLQEGIAKLQAAGIEDAAYDAGELLLFAADMDLTHYLMVQDEEIPAEVYMENGGIAGRYEALIRRRAAHVPLQHLTGVQCFYGLDFMVSSDVLIPRPETEVLAEEALKVLADAEKCANISGPAKKADRTYEILDLCTGSGCILITLLHEAQQRYAGGGKPEIKRHSDRKSQSEAPGTPDPGSSPDARPYFSLHGTGADLSEKALKLAEENAQKTGVAAKWVKSDLFSEITGRFDLIVSNPPYIRSAEIETLAPEVRDYDPRMALDGGDDGLVFYRAIASQSPKYLKKGGRLILEIGYDQAADVSGFLAEAGFYDIRVIKDLNGCDRVIRAGI